MTERFLRRKLSFRAHGRTLVLVKHPNEKLEHRLMMALLWALYLPQYPGLRVDVPIGRRYRPDLVQLAPDGQPQFWAKQAKLGPKSYMRCVLAFARRTWYSPSGQPTPSPLRRYSRPHCARPSARPR